MRVWRLRVVNRFPSVVISLCNGWGLLFLVLVGVSRAWLDWLWWRSCCCLGCLPDSAFLILCGLSISLFVLLNSFFLLFTASTNDGGEGVLCCFIIITVFSYGFFFHSLADLFLGVAAYKGDLLCYRFRCWPDSPQCLLFSSLCSNVCKRSVKKKEFVFCLNLYWEYIVSFLPFFVYL